MKTVKTNKVFVAALAILGAFGAQARPKLPYDNVGACPFECCTYRECTVKIDTAILAERRDGCAAADASRQAFTVQGFQDRGRSSEPGCR